MEQNKKTKETGIININKKTFINVLCILYGLVIITIALTYILPKGSYGYTDGVIDYTKFIINEDVKGINIFKGIFSPILVLTSGNGLALIMLSIFILVVSGAFQVMSDCGGMMAIVNRLVNKFKDKKMLLISIICLIFMMFGSFFGLFEEMLTLLPLMLLLALSLGYDSYTGFLMCIVATGFGFSTALTNPFTVIIACNQIGCNPMSGIWYRAIAFVLMYGILLGFIFLHIRKIEKDPSLSPTYEGDELKRKEEIRIDNDENKRVFNTYVIFLLIVLCTIILASSFDATRDYSVVFLIVLFLFGGIISGILATKNTKMVLKSFLKGVVSAAPTIALVLLASSIKYVLEEGMVIDTISNWINNIISDKNSLGVLLLIFAIVLLLNFFIPSSNAKVFFVMGILGCITTGLSKEILVLAYLFGDGYCDLLYPTSPVLLISLSMTGLSYIKWLKKSKFLFLACTGLVILLLTIAYFIGY